MSQKNSFSDNVDLLTPSTELTSINFLDSLGWTLLYSELLDLGFNPPLDELIGAQTLGELSNIIFTS